MTVHSAADRGGEREADPKGAKRERILSAAERTFARHGFFAAKVSDVAKEAGVADGTIYLYFKSKDDLLISLFERRMQQLNEALRASIAGKPPREALRAFIRTYLQLCHDEPAATEVLTIELRQSSKFMKEYDNPAFADFLRMLGGVIAAAQGAGVFAGTAPPFGGAAGRERVPAVDAQIPPHIAARMIFGVLDELATAWILARSSFGGAAPGTKPKKFDIVRAADWVITLVTAGLEGKHQGTKESQ